MRDGVTALKTKSVQSPAPEGAATFRRPPQVLFFSEMVDHTRQVPAPSAAGWLFDLRTDGAPPFVVLRRDETEARECLGTHLAHLGKFATTADAITALAAGSVEYVGVIW